MVFMYSVFTESLECSLTKRRMHIITRATWLKKGVILYLTCFCLTFLFKTSFLEVLDLQCCVRMAQSATLPTHTDTPCPPSPRLRWPNTVAARLWPLRHRRGHMLFTAHTGLRTSSGFTKDFFCPRVPFKLWHRMQLSWLLRLLLAVAVS